MIEPLKKLKDKINEEAEELEKAVVETAKKKSKSKPKIKGVKVEKTKTKKRK